MHLSVRNARLWAISGGVTFAAIAACAPFELAVGVGAAADAGSGIVDGPMNVADVADSGDACNEPIWMTAMGTTAVDAMCNGAAVNLLTNQAHCGYCNHACAAEACEGGRCRPRNETFPMPLTYANAVASTPTRYLFTSVAGGGMNSDRVSSRGGNSDEVFQHNTRFDAITSIGEDVFAFSRGTVFRRSPGEMQVSFPTGASSAVLFATTSSAMYMSDRAHVFERGLPNDAGTARDITPTRPGPTITELMGGRDRVYWASNDASMTGTVGSWSQASGATAVSSRALQAPHSLAVSGDLAFFADEDSIYRISASAPSQVEVFDSSGVAPLDAVRPLPRVATDGKFVYWFRAETSDAGRTASLVRKSLCTGRVIVLMTGEAPDASGLFATRDRLFWTAQQQPPTGSILVRSIAK